MHGIGLGACGEQGDLGVTLADDADRPLFLLLRDYVWLTPSRSGIPWPLPDYEEPLSYATLLLLSSPHDGVDDRLEEWACSMISWCLGYRHGLVMG